LSCVKLLAQGKTTISKFRLFKFHPLNLNLKALKFHSRFPRSRPPPLTPHDLDLASLAQLVTNNTASLRLVI